MSKSDKSSSLRISSFTTRSREPRAEPPSPTLSLPSSGSDHVEDDLPSTSTSKANGRAKGAPAASSFSPAVRSAAQKRKADTSASEPTSAKRANGVVKKSSETAAAPSTSSSTAASFAKPVARVAPARGAPSTTHHERPGPSSSSSSSTAAVSSSRAAAPTAKHPAHPKPAQETTDPKRWMNGEGEPACPECGTLVGEDERKEHYRSLHYKELFCSPRALRRCSKLELFLGQRVGVISEGPRQCRACTVEPESRVKLLAHYRQEHPSFYYTVYNGYLAKKADQGDEEVEDPKVDAYLDLPSSRPFSII